MSNDRGAETNAGNSEIVASGTDSGLQDVRPLADLATRRNLALSIINRTIPISTFEQHLQTHAAKQGISVAQFTDETRWLVRSKTETEMRRDEYLDPLAESAIPESQMEEFVTALLETSKHLVPSDEAPDETIQHLARIAGSLEQAQLFKNFAEIWKDRFLTGETKNEMHKRREVFLDTLNAISEDPESKFSKPRDADISERMFTVFADGYEFVTQETSGGDTDLEKLMRGIIVSTNNVDDLKKYINIIKTVPPQQADAFTDFAEGVARYAVNHGLTDEAVHGLTTKLFPAIQKGESQVETLSIAKVVFAPNKDEFGMGDFVCHAYSVPVTPENINELIMIAHELPTTVASKIEQNRRDARCLEGIFGNLDSLIHDQRSQVHNVVSSMVVFYESGSDAALKAAVETVDAKYLNDRVTRNSLLDKRRYDSMHLSETLGELGIQHRKAIDLLRRIADNTKPFIKDKPPETPDPELNRLAAALDEEEPLSRSALNAVLTYVNNDLKNMMARGEIGIGPDNILLYTWLGRKGFDVLRSLAYEDQLGVRRQEWFHSILRFQELTASSSDFNEEEFQQFLTEVKSAGSAETANQLIFRRSLKMISKLADKYKNKGMSKRADALWSGNIAHELIGLIDPREGETAIGQRLSAEAKRPPYERLKGD